MTNLTIWTYDWVPEMPRGFVRDLRLRWACAEAGLAYEVQTAPFDGRETNHLARQPFGQVPSLSDGEIELFESSAGLLHLARKSDTLMPRDAADEAEVVQWLLTALYSIEIVTLPWWFLGVTGGESDDGTIIGEFCPSGPRPYMLEKTRQFGFDQAYLERVKATVLTMGRAPVTCTSIRE